jgi:hypothetical protein
MGLTRDDTFVALSGMTTPLGCLLSWRHLFFEDAGEVECARSRVGFVLRNRFCEMRGQKSSSCC